MRSAVTLSERPAPAPVAGWGTEAAQPRGYAGTEPKAPTLEPVLKSLFEQQRQAVLSNLDSAKGYYKIPAFIEPENILFDPNEWFVRFKMATGPILEKAIFKGAQDGRRTGWRRRGYRLIWNRLKRWSSWQPRNPKFVDKFVTNVNDTTRDIAGR